jgi:thiol-disulfide isomerase/thioredoxin
MRLSKLDPHFVASADAVAKGANERAAAEDVARVRAAAYRDTKIKVVSNGGERVDLASLMALGKITIVDFYADWCGPCRRISPQLEQLAKTDPDVVLLKIDIVNWNTPVTRQFGIQSIPNVRVFGRTGAQLGDGTPDLSLVKKRIEQAKGS